MCSPSPPPAQLVNISVVSLLCFAIRAVGQGYLRGAPHFPKEAIIQKWLVEHEPAEDNTVIFSATRSPSL